MIFYKHQSVLNRGFTLTEMVVAITIIVTLTSIFLANYYSEDNTRILTDASSLISQEIRKAQDLALVQSQMPTGCGGWPKSFGVYFNNSKFYIDLFGDKNSNGDYNISGACSCTSTNECVERQFLSSNVKINKIRIGGSGQECTDAWINFSLSDTTVQIKNGCSITDNSKIEIELSLRSGGEEKKTIIINNKGMVEIK